MVFGLMKECFWQRAKPCLLLNPDGELCLDLRIKALEAQVLQHVLAVFQVRRFSFRDLNRQRWGQIELFSQVPYNVRRDIMDVI